MDKLLTEAEIRKIAEKYVKAVRLDPAKAPHIKDVVRKALRENAPNRPVSETDVNQVLLDLSKRSIVNQQAVTEASKNVADTSAAEELKFTIRNYLKQLKPKTHKLSDKDVAEVIRIGKLNAFKSTPFQIRAAVQEYFRTLAVKPKPEPTPQVPGAPKVTPVSRTDKPKEEPGEEKVKVTAGGHVPPVDPKNMTLFEKIRGKMRRYGIKPLTRHARNWLKDMVRDSGKTPSRKTLVEQGESMAEAMIGKMFFYFYDAKTKAQLPYWDKFPLIFVIELYDDGWLGINLHYLPWMLRLKLFDKLMEFADNPKLDKIDKLKLSYALLKNVSEFPEVRPCIKRYLKDYLKSDLKKVDPVDWEIALFLPVEQFVKQPKEVVWQKSREKIKRLKGKR